VSHGWQCARCHVAPIKGVAYSCANCPSYYLCSECEPLANHPVSHVFFKFRKPLLPVCELARVIARPNLSSSTSPTRLFRLFNLQHRGAPWNHQIALTQAQSHSAKRSQLEPQPAQQQSAVDTAMTDMGGVGKLSTAPLRTRGCFLQHSFDPTAYGCALRHFVNRNLSRHLSAWKPFPLPTASTAVSTDTRGHDGVA